MSLVNFVKNIYLIVLICDIGKSGIKMPDGQKKFTYDLFLAKLGPKKHSCWQKINPFHHYHPFKPTFIHFGAFIQHPNKLTLGYVLVVPPERKIKNPTRNTCCSSDERHVALDSEGHKKQGHGYGPQRTWGMDIEGHGA